MTQPAYANERPSGTQPLGTQSLEAQSLGAQPSQDASQAKQKTHTQDEKFELLSAYMDDECSGQERQLVEHWLASDPQVTKQYQAQIKLQLALKAFFQAE